MNVNTRGSVYFKKSRGIHHDAFDFETSAHTTISKTIRLVRLFSYDVVFVLGCGKGRAVCHFARQHIRKVVGIEISEELCQIARVNAKVLRGRKADIEIWNTDAALADFNEGTIFFMFNPFGEQTVRAVLQNIEKNHDLTKPLTIIYARPLYSNVFNEFPWLEVIYDYERVSGLRVMVYHIKVKANLS